MAREEIVAGRYRIESRLGSGGMSTVHLAFDERLERHVAVKLLAEHLASDPAFVSRFQREALAAARLIHPNIVQVFDSGPTSSRDQHYIVMEYIDGHPAPRSCASTAGWRSRRRCRSSSRPAKASTTPTATAWCTATSSPATCSVARDGVVKLADFGIAKATEQSSITQVGSVLGTAAYLAPEQARGEEAGPTADLYALGVVTYQLISGRPPFEGASLTELAIKQQQEAPPTLDTLVAAVSPELAEPSPSRLRSIPATATRPPATWAAGLRDGAHGIPPWGPARRTRSAPPTQATSALSAGARPAARGGTVAPRRPRPGTARAAPAAQAAPRAAGTARQRHPPPGGGGTRGPRGRAGDRGGGRGDRPRADQDRAPQRRLRRRRQGIRALQQLVSGTQSK